MPTPLADRDDIDLYCLTCGYNLRGLRGDPRRCPECGNLNPLADLEVPATLIRAELRRMESAPVLCLGMAAYVVLLGGVFMYLFVTDRGPSNVDLGIILFLTVLAAFGVLLWLVGYRQFRDSCRAKSGWRDLLVRFHLIGLPLVILVVLSALLLSMIVTERRPEPQTIIVRVVSLVLSLATALWLFRAYRRLRSDLDNIQRDVAVEIARTHLRRNLMRSSRRQPPP